MRGASPDPAGSVLTSGLPAVTVFAVAAAAEMGAWAEGGAQTKQYDSGDVYEGQCREGRQHGQDQPQPPAPDQQPPSTGLRGLGQRSPAQALAGRRQLRRQVEVEVAVPRARLDLRSLAPINEGPIRARLDPRALSTGSITVETTTDPSSRNGTNSRR